MFVAASPAFIESTFVFFSSTSVADITFMYYVAKYSNAAASEKCTQGFSLTHFL